MKVKKRDIHAGTTFDNELKLVTLNGGWTLHIHL